MGRKKKKAKRRPPWHGAALIRAEREKRGWSLAQAAAEIYSATRVGRGRPGVVISPQSLQQYETGTEPKATAVLGLISVYNLRVADLLPK